MDTFAILMNSCIHLVYILIIFQVKRAYIFNAVKRTRCAYYQYRNKQDKQIQAAIEKWLKPVQNKYKKHGQEYEY